MSEGDHAGGPDGEIGRAENSSDLRRAHLNIKRKQVGLSDSEAAELARLQRFAPSDPPEDGAGPPSRPWSSPRLGLRVLDDIPPTDLLLAPTLQVLKESADPLEREAVCERLGAALGGYSPQEGTDKDLRNVLRDRTEIALSYLVRGAAITRGPQGYTVTSLGRSLSDDDVSTWFDRFIAEDNPVRYGGTGPDAGPWDMLFLPD